MLKISKNIHISLDVCTCVLISWIFPVVAWVCFVGLDRTQPLWVGTVRDTHEEPYRPRSLMDSPRAPRCTRMGLTSSLPPLWGGWSHMFPGRSRCDILWQILTIKWHPTEKCVLLACQHLLNAPTVMCLHIMCYSDIDLSSVLCFLPTPVYFCVSGVSKQETYSLMITHMIWSLTP